MRIEKALVAYLIADSGLKSLIDKRLYAFHAQTQVQFPFITYQRVSTAKVLTHDLGETTLTSVRIQFDIYSKTYANALAITDALREALQGYRGTMSGVDVQSVLPALEQHVDEPDMDYYRVTVDYLISHTEE